MCSLGCWPVLNALVALAPNPNLCVCVRGLPQSQLRPRLARAAGEDFARQNLARDRRARVFRPSLGGGGREGGKKRGAQNPASPFLISSTCSTTDYVAAGNTTIIPGHWAVIITPDCAVPGARPRPRTRARRTSSPWPRPVCVRSLLRLDHNAMEATTSFSSQFFPREKNCPLEDFKDRCAALNDAVQTSIAYINASMLGPFMMLLSCCDARKCVLCVAGNWRLLLLEDELGEDIWWETLELQTRIDGTGRGVGILGESSGRSIG